MRIKKWYGGYYIDLQVPRTQIVIYNPKGPDEWGVVQPAAVHYVTAAASPKELRNLAKALDKAAELSEELNKLVKKPKVVPLDTTLQKSLGKLRKETL